MESTKPAVLNNRKRKADSLGRIAAVAAASNAKHHHQQQQPQPRKTGRGALTGWTTCPLCDSGYYYSHQRQQKRYALGRGIATHLHAIHTPWKPPAGKAERKKRQRLLAARRRRRAEQNKDRPMTDRKDETELKKKITEQERESWEPTQQEIDEWDETVLRIVAELEAKASQQQDGSSSSATTTTVQAGLDRNGKTSLSYRESLPPFIQAAANGDLSTLQSMVGDDDTAAAGDANNNVQELLDLRDRNLSSAEHWAAGGGHLDCLQFLFGLRRTAAAETYYYYFYYQNGATSQKDATS